MGRPSRIDIGGLTYHVINRANAKAVMFKDSDDYQDFIRLLIEAKKKHPVQIFTLTLMPNHWHFNIRTYKDGDMQEFVKWLSLTHAKRWHANNDTVGTGHLYQGRYKSFPVLDDDYLLQVLRYVERNPLRAGLVQKAEEWRWSSLWIRLHGTAEEKAFLDPWPIKMPKNYLEWLNTPLQNEIDEVKEIRRSIALSRPFGTSSWRSKLKSIRKNRRDNLRNGSWNRSRNRS